MELCIAWNIAVTILIDTCRKKIATDKQKKEYEFIVE